MILFQKSVNLRPHVHEGEEITMCEEKTLQQGSRRRKI